MDWFPIVAGTFKALALATAMFFAVKWHYDQGKKKRKTQTSPEQEKRAVVRAAGKVAAVFLLSLLGVGLVTFFFISKLSLNLGFS